MKNYKITVLKGDGIGPEIVDECQPQHRLRLYEGYYLRN